MEQGPLLPNYTKLNDQEINWINGSIPYGGFVGWISYVICIMVKIACFLSCMVFFYETWILLVILTTPMVLTGMVTGAYFGYFAYVHYQMDKIVSGRVMMYVVNLAAYCATIMPFIASVGMAEMCILLIYKIVQLIVQENPSDEQKKNAPSIPYINALARYYFNNSLNEKGEFKRLLAMNYYLHSVFYKHINDLYVPDDFVEIELDKICDLQKNGHTDQNIITDTVSWSDIMDRSLRKSGYNMLKLLHGIYLWSIIQCIVQMSYLIYTKIEQLEYRIVVLAICIASYGILEMINYKNTHSSILKIGFYSSLILPNWSVHEIRYQIPWSNIIGTVDKMMKAIRNIHYIMFDQFKEIECLNEFVKEKEIREIISQFAWIKLPTYDDTEEFELDDGVIN